MDFEQFKKLIPEYTENLLQGEELQSFREFLANSKEAQNELESYQKTWEMLSEVREIEPSPNYVSRFWTEISTRESWLERALKSFIKPRLVPTLATACVLLIVGFFVFKNYTQIQDPEAILAGLDEDEIEMVENIELAENFDIIEDIDFLEDLDIIEELDSLET